MKTIAALSLAALTGCVSTAPTTQQATQAICDQPAAIAVLQTAPSLTPSQQKALADLQVAVTAGCIAATAASASAPK